MRLTSPAFTDGKSIPREHTCDGVDASPALHWRDAPASTQSFALICDDPDAPAGTWVHWVLYGVPAAAHELAGALPGTDTLPGGARQGMNDFGRVGYGGPCPPPGKPHRYFFKLYALDAVLTLKPRATKADLLQAMAGHILAEAQTIGTYQRKR
ncbi:MAG TPA: YbhB/YbcL family Raf kinase inhibitor-like protein [Opitutaceae bacterium]|nr:YbhB/YbcL family Raf kinase inhibitor-like protein [Opitutaceae bacterium]